MKFNTISRIAMAASVSVAIAFGTTACIRDYTSDYVYAVSNSTGQVSAFAVDYQTGVLTQISGSPFATNLTTDFPNTSDLVYSLIDTTGKYLYVANNSTTNTQTTTPYSSLSALTINSTNQELQPIIGAPYKSGSGPVCMVEDPSNQYLYVSNYNDGTITGYQLNNTNGELSDLTKGSTFTAVGKASCLAISGSVN